MIWRIVTTAVGLLGVFSTITFSAAFDCSKAKSAVEKLICADTGLSKADEELSSVYDQALSSSAKKAEFKKEQVDWIRTKRDTCRDRDCLADVYRKRIEVLSGPNPIDEYWLRERFSIGQDTESENEEEGSEDEEDDSNKEGNDEKEPNSLYYSVRVKVHGNPSAPLIDFEVYFPDSRQSVTAEFVRCKVARDGALEFAFTDNWGNQGKGKLNRWDEGATLNLEEVKRGAESGWGCNALRNYGDYELIKQKRGSGE